MLRTLRLRPLLLSLALVACTAGAGGDEASDGAEAFSEAQFTRPVVLPSSPLSLSNPQQESVTRPLWGGAFERSTTVGIRLAMEANGPSSGVLVGGRGDPEKADTDASVAVALVTKDGSWALRELAGARTVQELPVPAPASLVATLSVARSGKSVKVSEGGRDHVLRLRGELPSSSGMYVHLEPKGELTLRDVKLTQALPVPANLGTPLRKLAEARGISIGTATDVWPPLHDAKYEAMLGSQFDTAAPTEFYWSTTRGEDEDFFFLPADLTVNYAQVHGQKINGYFLAWDFELPQWLNEVAETGEKDLLGAKLDEHITKVVSRYKGKMSSWVVANEAIWGPDETNGGPARYGDSIWSGTLGPEYIERAFRTAHAADPNATLLYNETGAEALGPKSDFMFTMVKDLKTKGVPIGGVGLQFHLDAAKLPSMADVQANLARFGDLGLDVYITELDVSLGQMKTGSEADKQKLQAQVYGDVLKACLAVSRCRSYTVFGFSDKYAWDELGDARPLLFDKDYTAKPAYFTVQSLLGQ